MKKLIIVCEEKYRKFGDYLSQLISLEDDKEDEVVGTKDGEVAAQVWLEKDYQANSAQLSSNQYIIFIGGSKLVKEKSTHMKVIFSQYGISYGWLGKQAVITAGEVVSSKKYDEFIEFALSYQSDLERLIEKKEEKKLIGGANDETVEIARSAGIIALGIAGMTIVPIAGLVAGPLAGVNVIKRASLSNKIKEQQYSCATMKFYLSALSEFLGM